MNHSRSKFAPAPRAWAQASLCLWVLCLSGCDWVSSAWQGAKSSNQQSEREDGEDGGDDDLPPATPEIYLQAQAFTLPANTFNNPEAIVMWGYAQCTAGFASCAAATVPGPTLTAAEGGTLTVHLRNNLTGPLVEPTSLIVHGQLTAMTPVWIDPATGAVTSTGARAADDFKSRVRSFTAETPAGNTAETVYTWSNLKAGTFLYQSGTHPAVQVQMGLSGALVVYPSVAGRAYADPSSAFDVEVTLVFSEIDPLLHQAIAAGSYGPNPNAPNAPPNGWMTSTVGYRPQYFLINGKAYSPALPAIPAGLAGGRLLLRMLNAGLETKVPAVQGPYLSLIAEDGNFITVTTAAGATVPAPREQYSALLPAGKTVDALLVPSAAGTLAVFDRRLNLSNSGRSPGGMLTYLAVSPTSARLLRPARRDSSATARVVKPGAGVTVPASARAKSAAPGFAVPAAPAPKESR